MKKQRGFGASVSVFFLIDQFFGQHQLKFFGSDFNLMQRIVNDPRVMYDDVNQERVDGMPIFFLKGPNTCLSNLKFIDIALFSLYFNATSVSLLMFLFLFNFISPLVGSAKVNKFGVLPSKEQILLICHFPNRFPQTQRTANKIFCLFSVIFQGSFFFVVVVVLFFFVLFLFFIFILFLFLFFVFYFYFIFLIIFFFFVFSLFI